MKISIILDPQFGAVKLKELGLLAERKGIDTVWCSYVLNGRDPFTNLALLASETSRLNVGVIAVNPYEIHPARISTSLRTLSELCDGRAMVNIGGGGETLEALNLKPERRVRAVRECVELVKQASAAAQLNYRGEMYQAKGYHPSWAKAGIGDVYVGANMPQMIKMAAKNADGIFMSDMPPALVKEVVTSALATQKEASIPGEGFCFNNFYAWHVYEDKQMAVNEARQWLALRAIFRRWVNESFLSAEQCDIVDKTFPAFLAAFIGQTHKIEGVSETLINDLVNNMTLTGDESDMDKIIEKLQLFKDAGLTDISLRLYQQPAESIELIAKYIIPALK